MSAKLFGRLLKPPIMNASGPLCTTRDELMALAKSDAGAIVTKSMTVLPREGNPEPRVHSLGEGHLQSIGLANPGYMAYKELIDELRQYKPVIASVAGFNADEYAVMAEYLDNADIVEVNLGCPNIRGKRMMGYDPGATRGIARKVLDVRREVSFKLPPYLDVFFQTAVAEVLLEEGVECVTLVNSPGNCSALNNGKPAIAPKYGGLAGRGVKPIAIGNVLRFRELAPEIKIIGVGGIYDKADVGEFMDAGACAVQVGSALLEKGLDVFAELK